MSVAELPNRGNGGVIRFVEFDNRCPREIAESLTRQVAAAHGVGSVVLSSETPEDWALLKQLIYGGSSRESQGPDEPMNSSELVIAAVPSDATVVINARYAGEQSNYEGFASALVSINEIVGDLSRRLN